ncbi:MAG: tripartite tricarboxylate transporter substrate binding protein [Casimicrobiaceae bacterium]
MTNRRRLTMGASMLAVIIAAALGGHHAWSQPFPSKPVTVIVPYAPGATDREARKLAELAAKQIGQPIVVENKDGAGGAIGAQFVAQSKPDGHTLLYAAPAVITVAPLVGKPPYKYDDLMAVARATTSPHVLAARADAPFKSLREMITYAKANPGKVVFGSSGNGTAVHLAGEAFADTVGIKFNHVPYRGLAPAITAALGGFVDVVIGLPSAINPQIEGGKMRSLAQFGPTRAPALPDVLTLKELGIDLALGVDIGLFAPKGTPPAIVAKIDEAFSKAIESDEFKAFAVQALVAPGFLPAADYQKVVDAERALYAKIVPKLALGDK